MKVKVYTPSIAVTSKRENEKLNTHVTCYGAYPTRSAAMNQIEYMHDHYSVRDEENKIKEPREYVGSMVAFGSTVNEEVIDTEDFDEHKPDFDVEIEVTITKRLTVTVTSDDLESGGWDHDDVEFCAEGMYENGEFDDEIEREYEYNRDMEIRDYVEQ